jgi:hypothetical protein
MEKTLLENPSYLGWKKLASKIPFDLRQKIKNTNYFVLIDYVKWLLVDKQRPDYYHPYGLFFYTGLPGTGKTIFLTRDLYLLRKKYGSSILIGTNYNFKYQDFEVKNFTDIIKLRDKPTVIGYDEIQNDFDARNWEKLDSAFSERITQSRKLNGLMILATAQKFSFVDRRLRQLTHLVYECRTFKNRLTIAKVYEPQLKEKIEDGQYTETVGAKSKGFKFFVQSDYIRSLYSSYQILLKVMNNLVEYTENKAEKIITDIKNLITD